ncbi:MAG: YgiQ family radical SAM protein [Candidatus Contendobacter odensis]|uniref:YgiQ family radical SAM protein n=1 Tax=Candidatus Contendibacter odensensis TaxID=1400860 RepID=A0A2G6PF77_9GAMM|nr:MAG: YgiQ family radical SAM protein [Candidatus Contendobacter odensis]
MPPLSLTPSLFSYRKYWAARFGVAPFLPMSCAEMDTLGWDSCDIIIVTGDAYVDHPSFGMAIIGRLLEAQGFRVGIIAQPDWTSVEAFQELGRPNLFFGVTAGNMDSMVNRYTSDRRLRHNDAYTPNNEDGKRPDRAVIVYSQRCREAYSDTPIVIGGIEASLRRIAHYDYWSDKVRRSILLDSRADILLYGNSERAIVDIAHRIAAGQSLKAIHDLRGTVFIHTGHLAEDWLEIDSTEVDQPGLLSPHPNPYAVDLTTDTACARNKTNKNTIQPVRFQRCMVRHDREKTVIRLPDYERVKSDAVLYVHTSRLLHLETNPGNARALVQRHGNRDVWLNPPPIPLSTAEMDALFDLPFARVPHPKYGNARIPAYEMIRFSVNIMRGCFGGCTFCSITEHEGRIIQSRSEASILREIDDIRDRTPGFTGVISDLGGPTANMYRLGCKSPEIEKNCRKLSCVYPDICAHLNTDHSALARLYRKARDLPGIKKILIASGVRYDLAIKDTDYVKELVSHHVGGYLKIAPEHTEAEPLAKMMKPGMGAYNQFKILFEKYSKAAGKEQYLIPYFIAAHPGTTDEDMLNLALWLKANGFRADQVQAFLPSPMALATAMYHTGRNPLKGIHRDRGEIVFTAKGLKQRRLHKAFLRYHDPENWMLLRETLRKMGRADLIGNGKRHLIPTWQPAGTGQSGGEGVRTGCKHKQQFLTRHNGLPPRSHTVSQAVSTTRKSKRAFSQGSPSGIGKRRKGKQG